MDAVNQAVVNETHQCQGRQGPPNDINRREITTLQIFHTKSSLRGVLGMVYLDGQKSIDIHITAQERLHRSPLSALCKGQCRA